MLLNDYVPEPRLVTAETQVSRPRFPVIDCHNHLEEETGGGGWIKRPVAELVAALDEAGVEGMLDLDGGWGEEILYRHLDLLDRAAPGRFRVSGGVDWDAWPAQGNRFGEWAATRLREQARRGASGLKIWKGLGLSVTDAHGARVAVDDARLDALWATAGELGLPVTIHVADPVAFFDPLDERNERYEELQAHPDWHFPSPPFPTFMTILEQLANLVARHPRTVFIGAHVGCYAENLGWVAALLEHCPNFYVDFAARISELGRQPYAARRFFINYSDRILFGLDGGPFPAEYRRYYRFLESEDEYFPYGAGRIPGQGRWCIYGLHLPDEVLRQVYYANARRLFWHEY